MSFEDKAISVDFGQKARARIASLIGEGDIAAAGAHCPNNIVASGAHCPANIAAAGAGFGG